MPNNDDEQFNDALDVRLEEEEEFDGPNRELQGHIDWMERPAYENDDYFPLEDYYFEPPYDDQC